MIRILSVITAAALALSACAPGGGTSDGPRAGNAYRIKASDRGKLQFRMLDSVNALRSSAGRAPVRLVKPEVCFQQNGPALWLSLFYTLIARNVLGYHKVHCS